MFRGVMQLVGLAVVIAGCVKRLPPAPPPPAMVPPGIAAEQVAPPASGGRLIVDVVDGPTPVQRIRMDARPIARGFQFVETPEALCPVSPCVKELPPGNVLLGFPVIGDDATEVELVNIGPETSVYRRSLSVFHRRGGTLRVLGIIATSLGGASVATGTTLLPIGLSRGNDGLTEAGAITLGGGGLLIAIGVWAILHERSTYRPGSSTHFRADAVSR
jgi:hypothetical protein